MSCWSCRHQPRARAKVSRVLPHPPEERPPCVVGPEPWPELAPVWAPEFDPAGEPEFDPPGVPEFDPAGEPWLDGAWAAVSVGNEVEDEDGLVGGESAGLAASVPALVTPAVGDGTPVAGVAPVTADGAVVRSAWSDVIRLEPGRGDDGMVVSLTETIGLGGELSDLRSVAGVAGES